ncbi:hypothetical protein K458DRAFT_350541 [Lentithecium fluviatile CBS 122367]|uniref:SPX domain-containing protein n=1 Tax=Lentithecium fluviatile CBS 122367 TaxID=1168545 RepID=A0A6G1IH71_9PLEO|nr:hypothetical protein K458DRAFT_350541 [Lentithecium fluviatile CBS 122367]
MKYGDTLRQRSIPEWGHFNIDYDYLKDIIKHQTTSGTGKATSIPGQGETSERAFGDTFFRELKGQHDRINRFIRSKSGEIERRLEHISESLEQLQARQALEDSGGKLRARVVESYAKIDADVTKAGEEIRSLSRFQVTQRMGFRKILKKYRRWTKDQELDRRFRDEVTNSQSSFYQLDLGYLLDKYIDVLSALRAIFDASGASSAPQGAQASSPASRITRVVNHGTEVDFDLALSITPLGSRGSKATYWIHPDHIVEVEVLLLQQMRLHPGPIASTPQESRTTTPKRRISSANVDKYFGNMDETGLLILDHPESFAIKQNASTIGSTEETTGTIQAKAAGNARWASSGEAAVVVGLERPTEDVKSARLKRKYLAAFLDTDVSFDNPQDSEVQDRDETERDESTEVCTTAIRQWLEEHKNVKPIAGVCSKRTRFVGLHNNSAGGMWATLDVGIVMKDSVHMDLNGEEWFSEARTDSKGFPHAVLEVRREGTHSSTLIQTLDHSHLVERVHGFSMEAHAVWTCCKPSAMSAPVWISLLDNDIRKLPPPVRRQRRKASSTVGSHSQTSPPQTSTSATSLTEGQTSPFTSRHDESSATSAPEFVDPPPLQAFRKKRKPFADYPPLIQPPEPEAQRYWNEYDNPESEDEGYYIYLDPNESVGYPGKEFFKVCAAKTRMLFRIRQAPQETSSLSAVESSDDESGDESPVAATNGYGTFTSRSNGQIHEGYFSGLFRTFRDPHRELEAWRASRRERRTLLSELQVRRQSIEITKFRFYTTCIVMATVLSTVLGMMTITSRKKERGLVGYAVLFGTFFNFFLCLTAFISMKTRRERLGWLHQGVVALLVGANVIVDVVLLRWVFNQL